jgi:hypothetical protein
LVELDFTEYARGRMHLRMVPEVAVYQVVEDADRIVRRRDGRYEYFGIWEGRALLVVAEGDIEDEDDILILNVIEDVRRRR